MTRIFVNSTGEKDDGYYSAPATIGLSAIHFTVDSLAKAVHNFMYGGTDATVTGTPTFSSTGATFTDNVSYLTTDVSETENMTVFVIAKLADAGTSGAMLYGNYAAPNAGTGFGTSLFMSSETTIAFGSTRQNPSTNAITSAQAVINSNTNTSWGLYVGESKSTGNFLRNVTNGLTGKYTSIPGNRIMLSAKGRIGADYGATFDGQSNILAVVVHNASLSEVEIQQWIARLRKYAASRGITV